MGALKENVVLLLKNIFFLIKVPGTLAIYIPWFLVRNHLPSSGLWLTIASTLFVLGAGIYLWCMWDFAVFGRGTPAPIDEPKKLLVRGPYRLMRNPMYVGVVTIIVGWGVLFKTPVVLLYASCVWVAFHLFVVFYEEPHLHKVFGGSYDHYRAKVSRWLPRVGR